VVIPGAIMRTIAGSGGIPAGNAISFVGTAADDASTVTYSPTAGNLLIVQAKFEGSGATSTGCTWQNGGITMNGLQQCDNTGAGDLGQRIWWGVASGTHGNFTCTFAGSATFIRCRVFEFSKAGGTWGIDQQSMPATTAANGTSFVTGAITTGADNSVCMAFYGEYTSGDPTSYQIGGVGGTLLPVSTVNVGSTRAWYLVKTAQMVAGTGTATVPNDFHIPQLASWTAL